MARGIEGWRPDSLIEGDYIRITGNSTRNGSPIVSMNETSVVNPTNGAIVRTLGEDPPESVLNMEMVITDQGHLTPPHTITLKKPYTAGYEFFEVDCQKPLAC